MTNSPELPQLFEDDINLNGLFDILNPENNLVLADDMMLSDAEGVILWVSENYSGGAAAEKEDHHNPDHQPCSQKRDDCGHPAV